MNDALPLVPISYERLVYVIAALLVYQKYRRTKTPSSEERERTLLVLALLLPKLQRGIEPHQQDIPLLLTVDEVRVMKGALTTLLDQLKRKPVSRQISQEITRLKEIKTLLDHHFSTTQD